MRGFQQRVTRLPAPGIRGRTGSPAPSAIHRKHLFATPLPDTHTSRVGRGLQAPRSVSGYAVSTYRPPSTPPWPVIRLMARSLPEMASFLMLKLKHKHGYGSVPVNTVAQPRDSPWYLQRLPKAQAWCGTAWRGTDHPPAQPGQCSPLPPTPGLCDPARPSRHWLCGLARSPLPRVGPRSPVC